MRDRVMEEMSLYEKLNILSDAAKYDVSCSSSGVERRGDGTGMGNCRKAGICHMPQLFFGWQVYFSSEDSIYQ